MSTILGNMNSQGSNKPQSACLKDLTLGHEDILFSNTSYVCFGIWCQALLDHDVSKYWRVILLFLKAMTRL